MATLVTKKDAVPVPAPPPPAPSTSAVPGHARVHERGDARLDAVLDFLAWAAPPRALLELLDEAPGRLAAIVGADVTSLYLREGDGATLVMRGNVGFRGGALGQVRLQVGEGITGTAVQLERPISVVAAPEHGRYRAFAELDEEQFPVFCAVPIMGRRGPLGAVVVQRRGLTPFADADVELLAALSATIAAAVRSADLVDAARDRAPATRRTGGGTRRVVLPGRPLLSGRAVGALAAIKRPASRPREGAREDEVERLKAAFELADRGIRGLQARSRELGLGGTEFLDTYATIVSDARMRREAVRLCEDEGQGLAGALGQIARRVAAAAVTEHSTFLEQRARDIEDVCDALVMLAESDPRAEMPAKAVLIADRLTVFDVLLSTRWRPVAIALSGDAVHPRTLVLLRLLGLPAVVDVGGLFRWASDGDVALVDADHGLVLLNPSRSEVAGLREERKRRRKHPKEG